jgi:hypothetical protein
MKDQIQIPGAASSLSLMIAETAYHGVQGIERLARRVGRSFGRTEKR